MRRDGMQELDAELRLETAGAPLDQAKTEVDVAEELPLRSREEERAAVELERSAGVVEERGRDEEVAA
jgi:hypothetical protein